MNKFLRETITTLVILCVVFLFSSCSKDNDGPIIISPFKMFVRFQSASGTNILDSIGIMGDESLECRKVTEADGINLNWYKQSDNKELEPFQANWIRTNQSWNDPDNPQLDYSKMGTLLEFNVVDYSIWNGTCPNEESYLVTFKSKKIFGDEKIHTVKWDLHFYGNKQYEVYKCTVDDELIPLKDILRFYYGHNYSRGIDAAITIKK